jgi:1-phosphatidylinositol-3-phosphate 5-kinase
MPVFFNDTALSAAHLAPFYLREHSKRILRGALYNDSKFLADLNVMDYSLIVGVDSQKNELVVGIVGELCSMFLASFSIFKSPCQTTSEHTLGTKN